jgi:hypothetical protein
MGAEPLLWSADLVAWSTYRVLAVDDDRWIKPVQDVLTMIDAVSGARLDMNVPRGAAALGTEVPLKPGARIPTGRSGQRSDVRAPILPPGGGFLEALAAQSVAVRRSLGPQGHANLPANIQTAARAKPPWEVVQSIRRRRPEDDQPAHRSPTINR